MENSTRSSLGIFSTISIISLQATLGNGDSSFRGGGVADGVLKTGEFSFWVGDESGGMGSGVGDSDGVVCEFFFLGFGVGRMIGSEISGDVVADGCGSDGVDCNSDDFGCDSDWVGCDSNGVGCDSNGLVVIVMG